MRPKDENRAAENPEAKTSEPSPLNDRQQRRKDVAYTPSSETETAAKQDIDSADLDDGIDPRDVRAVPGTGGPDDAGDVDVDPSELNLPQR